MSEEQRSTLRYLKPDDVVVHLRGGGLHITIFGAESMSGFFLLSDTAISLANQILEKLDDLRREELASD